MKSGLVACVLLGGAALCASDCRAAATSFSDMVIFGDSLSDTGNVYTVSENPFYAFVLSIAFPDQTLPYPDAPYFNKRFSNGPIWVDYLATHLGLPTPQNDFENNGLSLDTGAGSNYAVGGGETSDDSGDLIDFDDVDEQVDRYLGDKTPAGDELFVLLSGGNNINNGQTDHNAIVGDLTGAVSDLYAAGARHVLVSNLPLIGLTPGNLGDASAPTKNQVTMDFNVAFDTALDSLEASLAGLELYRLDLFGLMEDVLANPASYGFNNTTDAAFDEDTQIIDPNFDDDYVFWDDIHPTTQFHELMGAAAFAAIPEPTAIGLLLVGFAWRRRR